jgi:hypothetical protein
MRVVVTCLGQVGGRAQLLRGYSAMLATGQLLSRARAMTSRCIWFVPS